MLYPVYISAVVVFLLTIDLFWSMDEMRAFLGDKGIEYCWKYGNFHRYLYTNLALTCVDVVVLLYLYRLARHDRMFAYLVVWAAFLIGEPIILSFFDLRCGIFALGADTLILI